MPQSVACGGLCRAAVLLPLGHFGCAQREGAARFLSLCRRPLPGHHQRLNSAGTGTGLPVRGDQAWASCHFLGSTFCPCFHIKLEEELTAVEAEGMSVRGVAGQKPRRGGRWGGRGGSPGGLQGSAGEQMPSAASKGIRQWPAGRKPSPGACAPSQPQAAESRTRCLIHAHLLCSVPTCTDPCARLLRCGSGQCGSPWRRGPGGWTGKQLTTGVVGARLRHEMRPPARGGVATEARSEDAVREACVGSCGKKGSSPAGEGVRAALPRHDV